MGTGATKLEFKENIRLEIENKSAQLWSQIEENHRLLDECLEERHLEQLSFWNTRIKRDGEEKSKLVKAGSAVTAC